MKYKFIPVTLTVLMLMSLLVLSSCGVGSEAVTTPLTVSDPGESSVNINNADYGDDSPFLPDERAGSSVGRGSYGAFDAEAVNLMRERIREERAAGLNPSGPVVRSSPAVDNVWFVDEGLREKIFEITAALAFNEAYQFRTEDGRYIMVTGSRRLTGREEFRRYFPQFDLPGNVGDFRLSRIEVWDGGAGRGMFWTWDRPMPLFERSFFNDSTPAPVGEIFTRKPLAFWFFAMYENSSGEYAGMRVRKPVFMPPYSFNNAPFSVLDMEGYGRVYFERENFGLWPFRYIQGMFADEERWLLVELSYYDSDNIPLLVSREELEDLIRIFNPAELVERYSWPLQQFQ